MKNGGRYKAEFIADSSSRWVGNGVRFDTPQQAELYAMDFAHRWMAVIRWRVVDLETGDVARKGEA